jgi:hypothetical protein
MVLMRTAVFITCLTAAGCLAATACAQAVPPSPSKLNADRLRWIHYKMVAGRVAVSSTYPGTNMTFGPAMVNGRRREQLEVHITPGNIQLEFELAGSDEQLSISLDSASHFTIRRSRNKPHQQLVFEQLIDETVGLEIADGGSVRRLKGRSLWHLYLAEPELIAREVVPLLELLHPSWQLAATGAAAERALLELAAKPTPPKCHEWLRLVQDLSHERFVERASAERALRTSGQGVVPFLQSLGRDTLDAEQAARVRVLIDSLSDGYEDSAERIVPWLAGDPQAWLALLARDDVQTRRLAARQLALVWEGSVAFDPDGEKAGRDAQLARLWERAASSGEPNLRKAK